MNIVLIDIDSLRPDHLGAYGYGKDITPAIDRFAGDAVRFDNAYAAASPSLPSRASLITGRHSVSHGVATHGPSAYTISSPHTWETLNRHRRPYWTLPELFFEERVPTAAVAPDGRHPAPWLYHVWHEFHHPQEPGGEGEAFMTVRAESVTDTAIDVLQRHEEDLFLYLQYWDPHAPCNRSDEEIDACRGPLDDHHPATDHIAESHDNAIGECSLGRTIESEQGLEQIVAEYDAEIRYLDRQLGRLFDWLRENGIYDDSLIVLTADHGEELGEHGVFRDHWSTFEGTQRIPLLLKPPGGAAGEQRDELATNVDLAPTLADYAGLEQPQQWQGRSLREVVEDSNAGWRDSVVVDHGLYTVQRAVRTGRWKLIRTYHPGQWSDRLLPIQLFDLDNDPWEQENVADVNADVVSDLMERMHRFVDTNIGRDGDPIKQVAEEGPIGSTVGAADPGSWL